MPDYPPAPPPAPPSTFDQTLQTLTDAYLKIKLAKAAAKQNDNLPTQAQNLTATNPQTTGGFGGIPTPILIGGGVVIVLVIALVALKKR